MRKTLDTVFDRDVVANRDFILDKAMRTNVAILTDRCASQDNTELPNVCALTNLR